MQISVSDAKGKLTDLVRRAEAGDDIVLTRRGLPAARLVRIDAVEDVDELRRRRRAAIDRAVEAARARNVAKLPDAARSADFLYGEDGLPA